MSDALPLPPHPDIEQYKKLAKDFQQACKSPDPGAVRDWAARWAETIARLQGREITENLRRQIDYEAERMARHWQKFKKTKERAARCTLAEAQYFVARGHGFASWPKFARHLQGLAGAHSPVSRFEAAVDAIVGGDATTLVKLLDEDPDLVRARSTREHRSTLLHYVSANGVEDFRQKTPKNIVEITKLLLNAGADVNAESDAYGGRSTTLGLTATSCHPEEAGVQLPLMDLLIGHGAAIDGADGGSAVNGCLHNGRGEAAEYLGNHGADLDLEADRVYRGLVAHSLMLCPAMIYTWRDGGEAGKGIGNNGLSAQETLFANQFLVNGSANQAPPGSLGVDQGSFLNTNGFRIYQRLQAYYEIANGQLVTPPHILELGAFPGSTPEPCTGLELFSLPAQANSLNGQYGLTSDRSLFYQVNEARLGRDGQGVNQFLNGQAGDDFTTTTPWIWLVIQFDVNGNTRVWTQASTSNTTTNLGMFPTYQVYTNGFALVPFVQGNIMTFIGLNSTFQYTGPQ